MSDRPGQLRLEAGPWELLLAPPVGGSVGLLRWRGLDILRPVEKWHDVLQAACFPLLPFSNRIGRGRFDFHGRVIRLRPNYGDHPHPIHGSAWRAVWRVRDCSAGHVTLVYEHSPGEWPWAFVAEQTFSLAEDRVDIDLVLQNQGPTEMPAGLGLHPFFPATARITLEAGVRGVWMNGSDSLPSAHVKPPEPWDWCSPRRLESLEVDNVFTGWNGCAVIRWPERALLARMSASPELGHLVVYAPPGTPFVCVEPVSHMTDAVNRREPAQITGLRLLQPGDRLAARVSFTVERT